jgi:Leucine rich repeat
MAPQLQRIFLIKYMIRKLPYLIFLLFLPLSITAQCTHFQSLVLEGDAKFKVGDLRVALNKYQSAIVDCRDRALEVQPLILLVFDRIDEVRKEADIARNEAIHARDSVETLNRRLLARNAALDSINRMVLAQRDSIEFLTQKRFEAEIALLKEQRENRKKMERLPFGPQRTIFLASEEKVGGKVFFYIDADGKRLRHLGEWDIAQHFQNDGYATVKNDTADFMIDSSGTKYPLFKRRTEGAFQKALAAEWNDEDLKRVPRKVKRMQYLRLLFLNMNHLKRIPKFVEDLQYLQELQISDNEFRTLPKFLGNDSALTTINASGNLLRKLPRKIGHLPQLKILNLSRNRFQQIPQGIMDSKTLVTLDMSHNQLRDVHPNIGKLGNTLEVLDLCFNKLDDLPREIGRLDNLKILSITGNEFGRFPKIIYSLKSLQVLRIGDNPCSNRERERNKIRDDLYQKLPGCQVYFY